jgi:signal transduction histidine kinase
VSKKRLRLPGWRMAGRIFAGRTSGAQDGPAPVRAGLQSLLLRPTARPLALGLVVAASLIAAETLVLYPLKGVAPANALGVVYLLGVLVVAIGWGFWLAAATSLASALAFDYFHVPPALGFIPTYGADGVALGIFLVVALLASTLAQLARSRAAEADQRRREASSLTELQAALRRVATLVARGAAPSEVFSAVADEMARCLNAGNASVSRFEGDEVVILALSHLEPRMGENKPVVGERFSLEGNNVAATVLHTGHAARQDSSEKASGAVTARIREMGLSCTVAVPIVVDGRLWGMAAVASSAPEPLPPNIEARMGDFADLVATAIANAATRAELIASRAELIASRARIVTAADDGRRRLERDLHDGAQQRLVALGLQLRLAQTSVPPELDGLKEQLGDIVSGLTGVSTDLQEISRGIHPAILSKGGLGPALKSLARRSAVPVALDLAIDRRLPDSVEVGAYFVVSEALTNAAKHSRASQVAVCGRSEDDILCLSIRDDGIGGADSRNGSGLVGLIDRVEALGGRMRITSPAGSGTSLDVTIPLDIQ